MERVLLRCTHLEKLLLFPFPRGLQMTLSSYLVSLICVQRGLPQNLGRASAWFRHLLQLQRLGLYSKEIKDLLLTDLRVKFFLAFLFHHFQLAPSSTDPGD